MIAAYVETPAALSLPADRPRVDQTLRLAEQLGARTVTLSGTASRRKWSRTRGAQRDEDRHRQAGAVAMARAVFGSLVDELIRRSGQIDIYVIRGDEGEAAPTAARRPCDALVDSARRCSRAYAHLAAATAVGLAAVPRPSIARRERKRADALLARRAVGRDTLQPGGGDAASVSAVTAFDLLFVPPLLHLSVNDRAISGDVRGDAGDRAGGQHANGPRAAKVEAARQRERRTSRPLR